MNSLRNPKRFFLVSTLPVALLLALCYGEFCVIHTLLPPESVVLWQWFGAALGLLGLGTAAYATVQLWRRQPLGVGYGVVQLLAYSVLLYVFVTKSNEVLPSEIPRWMVPTDLVVMAFTFLMPTLAHAMLVLVARFTPDDRPQQAAPNFGIAVCIIIGWSVLSWVLSWVSSFISSGFYVLIVGPGLVLSTLSFFFFLVRAIYIVVLQKTGFWVKNELIWKIVVTIVLPLLGLAVNSGVFFGGGLSQAGIFGNFSSPWFYGLAVLNGVLLCVPPLPRPLPRLLLLAARGVLFGYTFYFFLVFLPFLPLSIPAILFVGLGFLVLAPLLLFVVHLRQLEIDVAVLRGSYPNAVVKTVLVAALTVLPLCITASYWHSRRVLHEALAYVYTPDYAQTAQPDAADLATTLAVVKAHKDPRQGRDITFLFGNQLPYLSAYFNWLVLDNLMLSNAKIEDLERVFFGAAGPAVERPRPFATEHPAAPVLRKLSSSSTYDARQQAWVSWVSLEVANSDATAPNGEYTTTIALPTGCWVSDYYLTIGNREERGILAEKKAALWVFAQIVNENQIRDPGLLAYSGPNEVAVRVYPVVAQEVRRTRIQFLHKEPCVLSIDGQQVALGAVATTPLPAASVATADGGVLYVSALAKQKLPLVQRQPYYHFLLDASADQHTPVAAYQARLAHQLAQPLPNGGPARFSLVNTYTTLVPAGTDWQLALTNQSPAGGFYLTGAIRRVLFEAQQHPRPTYPVIVVATNNLQNAVLDQDFGDFSSAYPESDIFYELAGDGRLIPHSLRHNSRTALATATAPGAVSPVRAWPDAAHPRAYLPNSDEADIVLGHAQTVPAAADAPATRWLAGLLLRGYGQWQSFHPETTNQERVTFIQASFRAGIMTPFTSFLALEDEAQKAALHRKQEQTLAANASLDTIEGDELEPTATPIDGGTGLLLLAGLLLAGWYLRRSGRVALR